MNIIKFVQLRKSIISFCDSYHWQHEDTDIEDVRILADKKNNLRKISKRIEPLIQSINIPFELTEKKKTYFREARIDL